MLLFAGYFILGRGGVLLFFYFLIRVNYAICRYVFVKKKKKEHGKKDHQFSALKKEKKIDSYNYKLSNYTVYFRICH